jgi:ubiquinone/menaquinone biosynthesis C-methylase UbiE
MKTGIKERDSIDWETVFNIYRKSVSKNSNVLEIGASIKIRTEQLALECGSMTGVEIVPDRIPPDFSNTKYVKGDWQKLSGLFAPESFDIAVASHVIEHVEHDETAFTELYKVLKPGGIAIISTPNRERLAVQIDAFFKGRKRSFPWYDHFREYTEENIKELISRTPFKNYQIIPVSFGITGWKLFIYMHPVPDFLKRLCGFWVIKLQK